MIGRKSISRIIRTSFSKKKKITPHYGGEIVKGEPVFSSGKGKVGECYKKNRRTAGGARGAAEGR